MDIMYYSDQRKKKVLTSILKITQTRLAGPTYYCFVFVCVGQQF